jgi:hypothetical protein
MAKLCRHLNREIVGWSRTRWRSSITRETVVDGKMRPSSSASRKERRFTLEWRAAAAASAAPPTARPTPSTSTLRYGLIGTPRGRRQPRRLMEDLVFRGELVGPSFGFRFALHVDAYCLKFHVLPFFNLVHLHCIVLPEVHYSKLEVA